MKIKIDEKGTLYLERAGKMKRQFCMNDKGYPCGDDCPAFDVHIFTGDIEIIIGCCGCCYSAGIKDFTDERSEA